MKINSTTKILTAFSIIALIATSCFLQNSDDDQYIAAPTVETSSTAVCTIGFSYYTGMKYANIIRQSSSDRNFSGAVTTENIGQIVPADKISDTTTFIFADKYTDSSKYYRYYIRYCTGAAYYKSKVSQVISTTGSSGEADIQTTPVELTFHNNLNKESYELALDTPTDLPPDPSDPTKTKFSSLAVIISSSTISQPFQIGSPATGTTQVAAQSVNLQNILPESYLGDDLSFVGVIAILTPDDTKNDDLYTTFYWSKPLLAEDGATKTVLHISNTNKSNTTTSGVDNSKFIVPPKTNPTNILDYGRSVLQAKANDKIYMDISL